jgi:ABC-type transport system substrate-binding protein
MYTLRWVGANTDPDIFEYVFGSKKMPPVGANRGHYRNAELDVLLDRARVEMDPGRRKAILARVQEIVAGDEPYINLWYVNNVCVHRERLEGIAVAPGGDYDFLVSAYLR